MSWSPEEKSSISSATRQEKTSEESSPFYNRKPTMPPRPAVPPCDHGLEQGPAARHMKPLSPAPAVPGNTERTATPQIWCQRAWSEPCHPTSTCTTQAQGYKASSPQSYFQAPVCVCPLAMVFGGSQTPNTGQHLQLQVVHWAPARAELTEKLHTGHKLRHLLFPVCLEVLR